MTWTMPRNSLWIVSKLHELASLGAAVRISPIHLMTGPIPHAPRRARRPPSLTSKFKTQGAPDHVAFLCDTLTDHRIRPINVLKKAGLDLEEWDDPAVVNALFPAAKPFLRHLARLPMPPMMFLMMTQFMTLTVILTTYSFCLLWERTGFFSLSLSD